MSSPQAISGDFADASDRRSCSRKPLNGVILVFFDKNNWGKLVDVNESGMSLEFDQPPPLRQGIRFSLEAMCRAATPSDGEMIRNSVQVDGEVKWIREFERTAGVQFLNQTEENRQQIRQWLSIDACSSDAVCGGKASSEGQVPQTEALGPVPSSYQTPDRVNDHTPGWDLEIPESDLEPFREAPPNPRAGDEHNSPVLCSSFTNDSTVEYEAEDFKLPEFPLAGSGEQDEEMYPKERWTLKVLRVLDKQFPRIGVPVCLAVLAVGIVIRMTSPQWMYRSDTFERGVGSSANESESTDSKSGMARGGRHAFSVEVLGADNRRRLLRFVDDPAKRTINEIANKSGQSSFPRVLPSKAVEQERASRSPEITPIHRFRLDMSKAKQPAANGLAANPLSQAAPAPEFVVGLPPSLETPPIGSILANSISSSRPLPVGGKVQPPHLIKSVPPIFPAVARTIHVDGDVTMDAHIDEAGNVRSATVLSGPAVLQQAALDALLQWKYEPARLDGNPVSLHLSVTMKFRIK